MLFEEAIHIAKASPLLMFTTAVMGYFLTYEKTFLLLLIGFSGNTIINYLIKHAIMKPLMGDRRYPIIGQGPRPKGATSCGLFEKSKITDIKSFGMPSGHAQMAGFFTAYSMSKLGEDKVSLPFYVTVGSILSSCLIFIMYSRVYSKCHTIQQTVAGCIIGLVFGNIFFNNKERLGRYIPNKLYKYDV
jgi:membrane-associated phospholipid phosphatase